jgi:hypothetical protein
MEIIDSRDNITTDTLGNLETGTAFEITGLNEKKIHFVCEQTPTRRLMLDTVSVLTFQNGCTPIFETRLSELTVTILVVDLNVLGAE